MSDAEITPLLAQASEHHLARRYAEAIAVYEQILSLNPDSADVLGFLASALRSTGRLAEAIETYDRLESLAGDRADFWYNRGNATNEAGDHERAAGHYLKALAIEPESASVWANLAIALIRSGREDDGIDAYRQALAIEPDNKIALHNLGNQLSERGQSHEAAALLRRTVLNWPEMPEGHYNLGLLLLRMGDLTNGFREYEWRWDTSDFFAKPSYRNIPIWDGSPFAGKRLIVHAEQGLGDAIQFSKLVGLARSLGGDVVYHVPEKVASLLSTLPFDVTVTGSHGAGDADFQIPVMSLPHRLKLTLGSIPQQDRYLSAEPARTAQWRSRLALDPTQKTIGVVWQGNPHSPAERGRSLSSPELLAPFAALAGVRLVALQKLEENALERAETPSGWRVAGLSFTIEHPGHDMDDGADAFVDTAAIMEGLDMVVSVCTAPLHLAGALGRPTIALLRAVPDWRWLEERLDTPWYPSMALCRQRPGEGYGPVIEKAVAVASARLGLSPST